MLVQALSPILLHRKFRRIMNLHTILFFIVAVSVTLGEMQYIRSMRSGILNAPKLKRKLNWIKNKPFQKSSTEILTNSFKNNSVVIISFMLRGYHQGLSNTRYDIADLVFDANDLHSAELRIFKESITSKNQNFTISIYQNTLRKNNELKCDLVAAKNISAVYKGWIEINVTESLKFWMKNRDKNYGFKIKITDTDSNPIDAKSVGFIGNESDDKKPIMLGFFINGEKILENPVEITRKRITKDLSHRNGSSRCQRHSWYVSFNDIGLDEVIIAPEGYYADFCYGTCPYFGGGTFHSMIQRRGNFYFPNNIPAVCCRPIKYSPITLIYYNENDDVKIESIKDAVVERCECT